MKKIMTSDKFLKAEIYASLINDRRAKLFKYTIKRKGVISNDIKELRDKLLYAQREVKIWPDEPHFQKWEKLIIHADATIAKANVLR